MRSTAISLGVTGAVGFLLYFLFRSKPIRFRWDKIRFLIPLIMRLLPKRALRRL